MIYDNSGVRRRDRLLEEQEALEILKNGEYGVLSMVGDEGEGYGVPLSYVFEEDHFYFHCALEGKKLRALEQNGKVSFCVVGRTMVLSKQFSTEYESVVVTGNVVREVEEAEKWHALELLLDKYSSKDKKAGIRYAEKLFARTKVVRVNAVSVSGKCRISG